MQEQSRHGESGYQDRSASAGDAGLWNSAESRGEHPDDWLVLPADSEAIDVEYESAEPSQVAAPAAVAEADPTDDADASAEKSPNTARALSNATGWGFRAAWLLMIFVLLVGLLRLNIGAVVEEICYALERGKQRAVSEDARVQLARLEDTSAAFRLVAKSMGPCVVHIDTLRATPAIPGAGDAAWKGALESSGQGSGLIVDSDGYILTNHHVIKDATEIIVRLSDGRTVRGAQIIGIDSLTDLAVLKIDGDGFQAAPWGDSKTLEVGDWVLAVGNPFGLDRSVTAGIVSAKGRRNVVNNMPYQNFLQTDAAVNPGNSGGPLINLQGEVVGINTAIVGSSFQGVSFAIPSEIAQEVYAKLRSQGHFTRGWLGVALEEITREKADQLNIAAEGVMVTDVVGEPARRAGRSVRVRLHRMHHHSPQRQQPASASAGRQTRILIRPGDAPRSAFQVFRWRWGAAFVNCPPWLRQLCARLVRAWLSFDRGRPNGSAGWARGSRRPAAQKCPPANRPANLRTRAQCSGTFSRGRERRRARRRGRILPWG